MIPLSKYYKIVFKNPACGNYLYNKFKVKFKKIKTLITHYFIYYQENNKILNLKKNVIFHYLNSFEKREFNFLFKNHKNNNKIIIKIKNTEKNFNL